MLKNYIKKLIMRWLLTWLNGSVATLNATLQLLVIYWFENVLPLNKWSMNTLVQQSESLYSLERKTKWFFCWWNELNFPHSIILFYFLFFMNHYIILIQRVGGLSNPFFMFIFWENGCQIHILPNERKLPIHVGHPLLLLLCYFQTCPKTIFKQDKEK